MTRSELADAMLKGKAVQGVQENSRIYIYGTQQKDICYACALGCALIGHYNGDFNKAEEVAGARWSEEDDLEVIADLLSVPVPLAIEIEHKHMNGMPIQQIAAWLKSSEGGEA